MKLHSRKEVGGSGSGSATLHTSCSRRSAQRDTKTLLATLAFCTEVRTVRSHVILFSTCADLETDFCMPTTYLRRLGQSIFRP